jgi:hypothetical protein
MSNFFWKLLPIVLQNYSVLYADQFNLVSLICVNYIIASERVGVSLSSGRSSEFMNCILGFCEQGMLSDDTDMLMLWGSV